MNGTGSFFRNTLIVLALTAATAWAAEVPTDAAHSPPARTLNLAPPDIRDVMPVEEWGYVLPDPDAVVETETVQVHGDTPAPYVPGGFAALYWAAVHPSQSWRILAPVQ